MDKEGAEFAIGTVVMIVLGLAVLIILILVVRQQVTKGAQGYRDIGEQAIGGGICNGANQSCMSQSDCNNAKGRQIGNLLGEWEDCQTGQICCKLP